MSYLERGEVTSEQFLSVEEHTRRKDLTRRAVLNLFSDGGWPWLEKRNFIFFGSIARGEATQLSDVDLGIIVDVLF